MPEFDFGSLIKNKSIETIETIDSSPKPKKVVKKNTKPRPNKELIEINQYSGLNFNNIPEKVINYAREIEIPSTDILRAFYQMITNKSYRTSGRKGKTEDMLNEFIYLFIEMIKIIQQKKEV